MTCKCNCHESDTPHATAMECAFAIAEEDARYAEIERWFDAFIASGGQRPFRSTK